MKFLKIFLILILFLLIIYINLGYQSLELNLLSISSLKKNEQLDFSPVAKFQENCHYSWLLVVNNFNSGKEAIDFSSISSIVTCSRLHIDMLRILYPKNEYVARVVSSKYPENRDYLYWLLDSLENNVTLSKEILSKIFELDQGDAVAWRRLGRVLWANHEFNEAITAYLNACSINDELSNGCYYVGTSYKILGDYKKAIYYFRLSYWPPSWEIADQLEAELSSQNP